MKKSISRILKYGTLLSSWLLIGSVLLQIFARFFLESAPAWTEEASRLFFIYSVAFAAGLAFKDDYYVYLEVFFEKLSPKFQRILLVAIPTCTTLLFGIMTVVQLQDLSRLDHPLLRELLRQAPGTYHHSMMVANLAEQAAERVDANGTLVRVGAFYHDIGKMSRPQYFTENQTGTNPHDSLDPYQSAEIILSHVTDGLELARRYRIPQRIQNFIAEHHGRGLLKVFYDRAKKQYLEEHEDLGNGSLPNGNGSDNEGPNISELDIPEVDINLFKYPGPRPNTRESGIVLLADTVEAASAAIRPSTETEIIKLVNRLVDDHLKAGQLDRSALTLGDIKEIKESFINTLKGRFHIRVRYPNDDKLIKNEIDEELEAVRQRRIPTIITRRRR
ncbi:MAG: HDIG domain-containing metalloprotein [Chloroflexota bacterium]